MELYLLQQIMTELEKMQLELKHFEKCYEALAKIKTIVADDSLEDGDCRQKIVGVFMDFGGSKYE